MSLSPERIQILQDTITKYSSNLPTHTPSPKEISQKYEGEVVVLTGSTGGLGSHLLAQLSAQPNVKKIYAFNRKPVGGESLMERQGKILDDRLGKVGIGKEILKEGGKIRLVETDMEKEDFGIGKELYEEIQSSCTLILHNAWSLNFKHPLSSFLPFLSYLQNLLRLSLLSPKSNPIPFIFISSISVMWNYPISPQNNVLTAPEIALPENGDWEWNMKGLGYVEAKSCCEKILERVAQGTKKEEGGLSRLKAMTVRVGTLAGSGESGCWAPTDFIPLMIKSSESLGVLPDGTDPLAWIPVDQAASAVLDFRHSLSPTSSSSPLFKNTNYQTLHVANPKTTPWEEVFSSIAQTMDAKLVSYGEWLEKLKNAALENQASGESATAQLSKRILVSPAYAKLNPAVKILDFYTSNSGTSSNNGREAMGGPLLGMEKALKESESLRETTRVGRKDAARWIGYWKGIGFLKN